MNSTMKKILFILLMAVSSMSAQTTLVNKMRASGFVKKNNYTRVLVQDSINGDVNWVLKSSIASAAQTLAQTLAIDNKTNELPIFSNNGNAKLQLNDGGTEIGYYDGGTHARITFDNTVMNLEATSAVEIVAQGVNVDADTQVDVTTPIFRYNGNEVSTTNQLTGFVETVTAGLNVSVDNTDPQNPIVSADAFGLPTALAVNATTGETTITSTNGVAYAEIKDASTRIGYDNDRSSALFDGANVTVNADNNINLDAANVKASGKLSAQGGDVYLSKNVVDTEAGLYDVADRKISTYSATEDRYYYGGSSLIYDASTGNLLLNGYPVKTDVQNEEKYVQQGVDNATTIVLSSSDLNTAYPSSTTGFKVYCTSIIAGKMVYEKTPSGWIGVACIIP